jgi:cytochrome c-type biogenesis protein CcmH/NrfF
MGLVLWLAAPAMLLAGLWVAVVYLRRRRAAGDPEAALSEAERLRIAEILKD